MPMFWNTCLFNLHTCLPIKMEQSVPTCWHIKFKHRGITQKKAYNIQNTANVWYQEYSLSLIVSADCGKALYSSKEHSLSLQSAHSKNTWLFHKLQYNLYFKIISYNFHILACILHLTVKILCFIEDLHLQDHEDSNRNNESYIPQSRKTYLHNKHDNVAKTAFCCEKGYYGNYSVKLHLTT
jgi:hypothetical protein